MISWIVVEGYEAAEADHLVNVFSCTLTHCFSSSTMAAVEA